MEQNTFEPNQELFAVYNSLGYLQDGIYFKEPDCNACLKDLLRFMRTENQHTFATRRQLGNCNFLNTDLAPLVKQHCLNDKTLFDYVVRLLSSLTTPPILLFKEQIPEDKEARKIYLDLQQYVFNYKTDLSIDVMFWSVIAKQMLKILQTAHDERQEEDKVMLERMLILIRNVLHVASEDEEDVIAGENNSHDRLLISMKKACIFDILIYICQTAAEHEFAFHVLEIFSLIYREQTAETLAKLTDSLRLSEAEKQKDIEHLKELKARSRDNRTHPEKFQRFKEATYVVKNLKSIGDNDMICHKAISDINELNLDLNKKIVRKAKNRRHFQDQSVRKSHSSSLELKSYLRDLAISFISTSYNLLMKTIRYYLERSKSQENDETYFVWAAQFFMEFNRCSSAKIDFVMETLSKEYLHYLHCLIESHLDHLKTDKKNIKSWSKRLHLGLKAYKELIYTLAHLQSKSKTESSIMSTVDDLKRKLFYEEEYRELIRLLIMVYDPIKMSDSYLNDLIEANHLFLKMLEYYCKKSENQVVIRKKARKQKKKKKKKNSEENEEQISNEQPELIWTELAPEISNILQGNADLPNVEDNPDLNVFSVLSEESKDEQKLSVMKKINLLLYTRRAEESVAIFREARNFFNDDPDDNNTFGSFDIQLDEELLALQNILMDDFLIDCNRDELKKLNKKNKNEEDEPTDLIDEEQEEEEEEESDDEEKHYKEQVFNFSDFVKSFANQKILQPYCLAFQKYETNSSHVNSCIIKMFHRLAFDCLMYCMFFQLSFFRTMQSIFNDHYDNSFYGELIRFSKFIINKFTQVSKTNPNVFIEMLYSKSSKDAYVVEHGYEEVKEPAKRASKKKKKNDEEESDFIRADIHSESEREEEEHELTAAEKYDKLFGNDEMVSKETRNSLSSDDELVKEDKKLDELSDSDVESDDEFKEFGTKKLRIVESEDEETEDKFDEETKVIDAKRISVNQNNEADQESEEMEIKSSDKKIKKSKVFDSEDEDEDMIEATKSVESPEKNTRKRKVFESEDEDESESESNKSIRTKVKKQKISSSEDEDESSELNVIKAKKPQIFESEDEDEEEIIKTGPNKSLEKNIKRRKIIDSDDEDEDNFKEQNESIKSRKPKVFESDDEMNNENDSKEIETIDSRETRTKKRKVFDSDEEESTNEKENEDDNVNLDSQSNNLEVDNLGKIP